MCSELEISNDALGLLAVELGSVCHGTH